MRNIRKLLYLTAVLSSGNCLAINYDYTFPKNMEQYEAGVRVKATDGNIYECKPAPDSEYCQLWNSANDRFEPGKGSEWQQAWSKIGGNKEAASALNANFKFVVMSDTQAWRHQGGGDPNSPSSSGPWEQFHGRVVESLNRLKNSTNLSFAIVNGDLTEFGRTKQWNSYHHVYNKLNFPSYIGLGNHDYANNVSDCYDGTLSNNGCASKSVTIMREHMAGYASRLQNYNDFAHGSYAKTMGSMAYSWDHGNLHFVQLQNYPTYSRDILSWNRELDIYITNSLAWLDKDLAQARARGKHIVLNFHDGNDHFINESTEAQKKYFKQIINKYKVAAIFIAHIEIPKQLVGFENIYGSVPVFVSAALYNGGYYLVSADSQGLTIDSYKEEHSQPKFLKTMARVNFPVAPEFCRTRGALGKVGDLYSNYFTKGESYYLTQQKTGRNLDSDRKGKVYLHDINDGSNQKFILDPATYEQGLYNRYYRLTNYATGRVLDSDTKGQVYTAGWNGGHYQQWKIFKTAGGNIMLTNRATGRVLDADSKGKVYTSLLADVGNTYQNWKLTSAYPKTTAQVYYYQLKTPGGFGAAFPPGDAPKTSNEHWQYVAEHDQAVASPCIGW